MNANSPAHHYRLFGLTIRSDLLLPELREVDDASDIDAEISVGATTDPIAEQLPTSSDGVTSFSVENVARYSVGDGRWIMIETAAGADPRNFRLFLLGSAFGILLQQRGILPIHANAVVLDEQAVLFMGGSGEGKSTLASWFHDRGLAVLADDVAAVSFGGDGRPLVHPGLARLRLWDDALQKSGRFADDYARSFMGDDNWTKYDVPIDGVVAHDGVPVAAIYELRAGDEVGVERLSGSQAFERIAANIYRGTLLTQTDPAARYWHTCARLVAAVPLFTATRPWSLDHFDGSAQAILDHARAIAS